MKNNITLQKKNCLLCGSSETRLVGTIKTKPEKETEFGIPLGKYTRNVFKCQTCKVYLNQHNMLPDSLYKANYNKATYSKKFYDTYKRIMALPYDQSDNKHRVKRILQFIKEQGLDPGNVRVLDVGSGLCVFLGELKKHGYHCVCIDPDTISIQHALEHVEVEESHIGTLYDFQSAIPFDLIAFNKVLEHVRNPIAFLTIAKQFLSDQGKIYVELPDGDNALHNGNVVDQEEFYIEHFTIFNEASIKFLAEQAGLQCLEARNIHEPSGKYTVYAFMTPN